MKYTNDSFFFILYHSERKHCPKGMVLSNYSNKSRGVKGGGKKGDTKKDERKELLKSCKVEAARYKRKEYSFRQS